MKKSIYKGWIGVDLDGTLAKYETGKFIHNQIGDPIPDAVRLVKAVIDLGYEVKIFTARMASNNEANDVGILIGDWTEKHLGVRLEATNSKDWNCVEIWDDRARQMIYNSGVLVGTSDVINEF
jgi:hypothetical protein